MQLNSGDKKEEESVRSYSSFTLTATTSEQSKELGLEADTVGVRRVEGMLEIALEDPSDNSDVWIPVNSGEGRFVISGVGGVGSDEVWYKRPSGSSSDHDFNLIVVGEV